jgi:protein kinase A
MGRKRSKSLLNNSKEFKFLEVIGTGGFSDVWKVENKNNGKIYALKVMEKARIIAKKSVNAVLLEKTLMS